MLRHSIALSVVAGAVVAAQAQPIHSAAELADFIAGELKAARVPGAGIAVVVGDEMLARGYGVANADTNAPLDAETAVHLGSLTKLFTALAVGKALEGHKLPLETPVGAYVAGLAPRAAAATFHDLLAQTSGIRDRPGDYGPDGEEELGNGARELTDADFLLPAGTVFSYSNLGYALAGAALEGLRKRPFAEVMRNELFVPLGMTRSTLRLKVATSAAHAVGHRFDKDTLTVVRPMANDTRLAPAGYMWASARDMARALYALTHKGRVADKQILPASVVERVLTPHVPMPNVFVGGHYGYGLMIARDRGVLVYEHGGTLPGFSSILRFVPDRAVGIAILSNLDNAPLRRVAQNAIAKALALPVPVPISRKEAPVTVQEMKPFLGLYRNRGDAVLTARDGRVVLILDNGPPMTVSRLESNRFLARPAPGVAGPEFVLQAANGDRPAYLHVALWAYVKQ